MLGKGYQSNVVELLLGYSSSQIRSATYFKVTNENIWDVLKKRPNV